MNHPVLPLWQKVIFTDWHGVLSRDLFWTSIVTTPRHPLSTTIGGKLAEIFARDVSTSHEWMKGVRTSEEIIAAMGVPLPDRYKTDYLRRRLDKDCRRMSVNVPVFSFLRQCRDRALLVVATDNMDCFVQAFSGVRRGRGRWTEAAKTLSEWATTCDDIICSSDVRTLKCEDPQAFFGPYLDARGLTFANALLIDDRADNCEAFTHEGGTALQWNMKTNPVSDLMASVDSWLAEPPRDIDAQDPMESVQRAAPLW